ncbi:hypothetical protein SSX86_005297 [Deinandra increscens subsp. villosa]|uniref:Peptidase A1 domain-containing protein n=1 Tax=Deinandra increscens subsp. villosa TaxID=3103831 RepID=A0AAP0H9X0_9ASTR
MAPHLRPLFTLFFLTLNHLLTAQPTQFHRGFLLKLTKDPQTHQHTTQLLIGTPQIPTKLLVHLSGHSLWLNCPPSSPSRNFITHGSLQCQMAKSDGQNPKSGQSCDVSQRNPITGETGFGDLAEDVVAVDGIGPISTVDRFLFSCSPEFLVNGLVNGAKGVLGFGKSKIGFQSQMVNNFDFPRKFTVCLSSSDGFIFSGAGVSNSLTYTPLMSSMDGYYVNVNAIKINGRRLAGGNPTGGVEISSTVPYTVMKSSLFEVFVKAFVAAASSMNLTAVAPVAPFGVCFSSPATPVPEIELVLQSELVKWRIQGRNLMVEVSDSVMCLGFVDGGLGMNGSMILGGHQLE